MKKLLFVGEERSNKAKQMNVQPILIPHGKIDPKHTEQLDE